MIAKKIEAFVFHKTGFTLIGLFTMTCKKVEIITQRLVKRAAGGLFLSGMILFISYANKI
jgi:hypothetical protein